MLGLTQYRAVWREMESEREVKLESVACAGELLRPHLQVSREQMTLGLQDGGNYAIWAGREGATSDAISRVRAPSTQQ